jgi:hypothetical protein
MSGAWNANAGIGVGTGSDFIVHTPYGTGAIVTDVQQQLWTIQQQEGIHVCDAPFYAVGDGETDDTIPLQAACALSVSTERPVILPPKQFLISSTLTANQIIGIAGYSVLVMASDFTFGYYRYALKNSGFNTIYNPSTAKSILYSGFSIESAPNSSRSFVLLGNVSSGVIENCSFSVSKVIIEGATRPITVDSLLDLYSCCKNITIRNNRFYNLTESYGTNRISGGGGGCLWVRNIRTSTADSYVTENIYIHNNYFEHNTTDECVAIYGVRWPTRNVHF